MPASRCSATRSTSTPTPGSHAPTTTELVGAIDAGPTADVAAVTAVSNQVVARLSAAALRLAALASRADGPSDERLESAIELLDDAIRLHRRLAFSLLSTNEELGADDDATTGALHWVRASLESLNTGLRAAWSEALMDDEGPADPERIATAAHHVRAAIDALDPGHLR